ncbi:type III-B CRISPR module RAMP protein Cmr1 [Caldisericum exile]|uniref:type III-B CRISPR module RAMP protein Cmr1 n=1 Tax=Caldisericum exile TaxID=693075 RepID=UPI003C723359
MKIQIKIKTKTPIWTGNIDSKSELIQSTSIIGSLRWWTEAILRGMGKFACDPTGDERCSKEELQYCPACLIFGATGVRRLFRLEISGGTKVFDDGAINIKPTGRNRGWYLGSGLTEEIPEITKIPEITLYIVPLDRDFDDNILLMPLTIAANWGGIGARTQHGYGVVELGSKSGIKLDGFKNALNRILDSNRLNKLEIRERKEKNTFLSNIKEIFFAKVQFNVQSDNWWKEVDGIKQALNPKDRKGNIDREVQQKNNKVLEAWHNSGSVPVSPAIKNWLRYREGRQLWNTGENWLFGTKERVCGICFNEVKRDEKNQSKYWCSNCKLSLKAEKTVEKVASKINISSAYRINENLWEFRIWGWIPEKENPNGFDRNNFLNGLKEALNGKEPSNDTGSTKIPWTNLLGSQTNNHKLKVWREFKSSRDTVKPEEENIESYLQSLLEIEEG